MGERNQVGFLRLVLSGDGVTVRGEYAFNHEELCRPHGEIAVWVLQRIAAAIAQWFDGVPVHTVGVCLTGLPLSFVDLLEKHLPRTHEDVKVTLRKWCWLTEDDDVHDRWEVTDG